MTYALYYYDSCPFCQRVLFALPKVNVEVEKRNVLKNPEYRQQQLKATGRTQVPCLLIENEGKEQWLYESGDIIQYLQSL